MGIRDQHPNLGEDKILDINFGENMLGEVPEGTRIMNLDGSDIAYFDLAVSYPFDKSLGWCGFDFDDYDDSQYMGFDSINEQDFLISASELDGDWYLLDGENPGKLDMDKFSLTYRLFNVNFYFEFYLE